MKTNLFNRTISVFTIVCAICLAAIFNPVKAQQLESEFYSNDQYVESAPVRTVCKTDESGKYFEPYMRYFFTYDNEGRVTKKEAHRWNKSSKSWKPAYAWQMKYEESVVVVNYAIWNKKANDYSLRKEKAIYQLRDRKTVAYSSFRQDAGKEKWVLVKRIMEPGVDSSKALTDDFFAKYP